VRAGIIGDAHRRPDPAVLMASPLVLVAQVPLRARVLSSMRIGAARIWQCLNAGSKSGRRGLSGRNTAAPRDVLGGEEAAPVVPVSSSRPQRPRRGRTFSAGPGRIMWKLRPLTLFDSVRDDTHGKSRCHRSARLEIVGGRAGAVKFGAAERLGEVDAV
jgi:hypothetical protein